MRKNFVSSSSRSYIVADLIFLSIFYVGCCLYLYVNLFCRIWRVFYFEHFLFVSVRLHANNNNKKKLFHKKPLRIARGQKATFFLKGTWIISKCAYGNGSSKKNHLILCEDAFSLAEFLSRRLLLAVLWPYHLLFAFHRSYSSERASLHSRLVKYRQAKLDVISICQL